MIPGDSDSGINWQIATVKSVHDESPRVKLFTLDLPNKAIFLAGQYYDIRLTAPDGYQAQRSYSVTSPPTDSNKIELAIELIEDGEVSSYFHELVKPGEKIEVRGPIGGYFTWSSAPDYGEPVLLVGGGSGIAPLMSMLRHRNSSANNSAPVILMFSVRTEADILFREELEQMASSDSGLTLIIALTRGAPRGWRGQERRIDRKMIDAAVSNLQPGSENRPDRAYICGSNGFVESISGYLLEMGMEYDEIRTERFGP
jgi:ferredoxin-NADP reductase